MVETCQPLDRCAHQMPRIEGKHDRVVTLGPKLLEQQLAVTRRVLPIYKTNIVAGGVFAQGFELEATAGIELYLRAHQRVASRNFKRRNLRGIYRGHNAASFIPRENGRAFHQSQRPPPSYPHGIDLDEPATVRFYGDR